MAEKQQHISRPLTVANKLGDQPSTVANVPTDQPFTMDYEHGDQPSIVAHVSTDQLSTMNFDHGEQPFTVAHVPTDQLSTMDYEHGDQPSIVAHVSTDQLSTMNYDHGEQPFTVAHVPTDQPFTMDYEHGDQPSTVAHVPTDQPSTMDYEHGDQPSTVAHEAADQSAPLAVGVDIGPPKKHYVSVLENKSSYYSRLGRVMVMYDAQRNSWHCPCVNARMSCPHKCVAKWFLFQTNRLLFKSVKSTGPDEDNLDEHQLNSKEKPFGLGKELLQRILKYVLDKKQYPSNLPENLCKPVFDPPPPKHIVPSEKFCTECCHNLPLSDPILITAKAKIVTLTCVYEGISTYFKKCLRCGMEYRYQDWEDGIHNFDNHILMGFHLCLYLRASLQTHNAAGRVFKAMELASGLKLPPHNRLFHGYLHFEALVQHDYKYSCINCGSHPPVVIMDLHKKGVFSMPVSEIPDPAEYTGKVNVKDFWESVSLNIISLGFVNVGEENPFVVKPTFGFWAPWIGPETRKSDLVLNTEWEKVHRPAKPKEQADVDISEDRLLEEVMKMKVDDVKNLCKACGVNPCGSKTDLILRLHNEIRSRSTYDKIFQKVWGASGGWSTVMCPCGVVYTLKFNMRAESPRDYIDILQSWQHLPNVTIYDFARGLATHGNLRDPLKLTFSPNEGRLLSPTVENISLAKEGKVKVNLPWLTEPQNPPDINGHPITGSSEHYVLYDKLHETNAKDPKDFLRRTALVPELAGKVNTQVAEQFFAQMEKNNYFLNMMSPSSQIFLIRNIVHHHNILLNQSRLEKIQKSMGARQFSMNKDGQLVIGHSQDRTLTLSQFELADNLHKDEAVTKLQNG
ncbi:uncharacterized protein LOC127953050 [Carassius gibelio]|uniref:uncharacterized protein LOC127953050 n=1 Tax=Carassius gibelio TaxID=101364 RepID=UPI0022793231|nr:uncharacterized protein LOC127953050 [Carassius gibelio]